MKKQILVVIIFLFTALTLLLISSYSITAETHTFIVINNNSEFVYGNGVSRGNGTEGDPYIISNWTIINGVANGIQISNTNASFIIHNCTILGSSNGDAKGIYLNKVTNGKIENNTINNEGAGILLLYGNNITISNNTITNTVHTGIDVTGSSSNTITHNILSNNEDGVLIYLSSKYNLIHHNFLTNNTYNAREWEEGNTWDDGAVGNCWGDYGGADIDNDGIGDSPQPITYMVGYQTAAPKSFDRYPIVMSSSQVDAMVYLQENATTILVTVSVTNISVNNIHSISLYWCNSTDNKTWGAWKLYDTATATPFSWTLPVVNETRYYQFYSKVSYRWILDDKDHIEDAPTVADAECLVYYPPPPNLPSTPSITTAAYTATDGNYSINWTTSAYAASFILCENNTQIYNGTNLTTTFTNKPNGTYLYKVVAWNPNGTSASSSEVTIVVSILTIPSNQKDTGTTKKDNPPDLSWINWILYVIALIGTIIGVIIGGVMWLSEREKKEQKKSNKNNQDGETDWEHIPRDNETEESKAECEHKADGREADGR